jgi:hypothetical protein
MYYEEIFLEMKTKDQRIDGEGSSGKKQERKDNKIDSVPSY